VSLERLPVGRATMKQLTGYILEKVTNWKGEIRVSVVKTHTSTVILHTFGL
jgi:hypothetical protein